MEAMLLNFDELEMHIKAGKSLILIESIYDTRLNILIGTEKVLTEKDLARVRERCPERITKPIHVRTTIPHFVDETKRLQWSNYILSLYDGNSIYKGLSKEKKDFVFKYIKGIMSEHDYLVWKISQLKSFSKRVFEHTVHSTFISLILFQTYSQMVLSGMLDARLVENIITASLLQDIGLTKMPLDKAEKKRIDLDPVRDTEYGKHPIESFKMIQGDSARHEIPQEALQAVLEHEEFLDGSGLPRGVYGADMQVISKILSISSYFENLLAGEMFLKPRNYRDYVAKMRIDKMKFDPKMIDSLDLSFKHLYQS